MDSTSYMIGIDVGTTSTKAVLYYTNGVMLASAHAHYPLYTPEVDAAEQNPDEIFKAVLDTNPQHSSFKKVTFYLSKSVLYPLVQAMHSLIPIDSNGKPLMNALTWEIIAASPIQKCYLREMDTSFDYVLELQFILWLR